MPPPQSILCKFCNGKFFKNSIGIHLKKCEKIFEAQHSKCDECGRLINNTDWALHKADCKVSPRTKRRMKKQEKQLEKARSAAALAKKIKMEKANNREQSKSMSQLSYEKMGKLGDTCDECERVNASLYCADCEQNLCKPCSELIHNKGARLRHERKLLSKVKGVPEEEKEEEEVEVEEVSRSPCNICGRKFATDRLYIHERVCKMINKKRKKRKVWDGSKKRIEGTEFEEYEKKRAPTPPEVLEWRKHGKRWREEADQFHDIVETNKDLVSLGKIEFGGGSAVNPIGENAFEVNLNALPGGSAPEEKKELPGNRKNNNVKSEKKSLPKKTKEIKKETSKTRDSKIQENQEKTVDKEMKATKTSQKKKNDEINQKVVENIVENYIPNNASENQEKEKSSASRMEERIKRVTSADKKRNMWKNARGSGNEKLRKKMAKSVEKRLEKTEKKRTETDEYVKTLHEKLRKTHSRDSIKGSKNDKKSEGIRSQFTDRMNARKRGDEALEALRRDKSLGSSVESQRQRKKMEKEKLRRKTLSNAGSSTLKNFSSGNKAHVKGSNVLGGGRTRSEKVKYPTLPRNFSTSRKAQTINNQILNSKHTTNDTTTGEKPESNNDTGAQKAVSSTFQEYLERERLRKQRHMSGSKKNFREEKETEAIVRNNVGGKTEKRNPIVKPSSPTQQSASSKLYSKKTETNSGRREKQSKGKVNERDANADVEGLITETRKKGTAIAFEVGKDESKPLKKMPKFHEPPPKEKKFVSSSSIEKVPVEHMLKPKITKGTLRTVLSVESSGEKASQEDIRAARKGFLDRLSNTTQQ